MPDLDCFGGMAAERHTVKVEKANKEDNSNAIISGSLLGDILEDLYWIQKGTFENEEAMFTFN